MRKYIIILLVLLLCIPAVAEEIYPEMSYLPEGMTAVVGDIGIRRYEDASGGFWNITAAEETMTVTAEFSAGNYNSPAEFISERWEDAVILREDGSEALFMAWGIAGRMELVEGILRIEAELGEYLDEGGLLKDGAIKALLLHRQGAVIMEMEKDNDDGLMIYEGEALVDGVEYEFEIDAVTGRMLEWERD